VSFILGANDVVLNIEIPPTVESGFVGREVKAAGT
jgi:hypothetical protein